MQVSFGNRFEIYATCGLYKKILEKDKNEADYDSAMCLDCFHTIRVGERNQKGEYPKRTLIDGIKAYFKDIRVNKDDKEMDDITRRFCIKNHLPYKETPDEIAFDKDEILKRIVLPKNASEGTELVEIDLNKIDSWFLGGYDPYVDPDSFEGFIAERSEWGEYEQAKELIGSGIPIEALTITFGKEFLKLSSDELRKLVQEKYDPEHMNYYLYHILRIDSPQCNTGAFQAEMAELGITKMPIAVDKKARIVLEEMGVIEKRVEN